MKYPQFFDEIETIKLKDDLSQFLGTFEEGLVEFSYLDIVKSAGHSCPTVAGAYLMALVGLKELYNDELPRRGQIEVSFKEDSSDGTAGVVANVVTQITGATETFGFKGINGKFSRNNLMNFNSDIRCDMVLKRVDSGKSVSISYDPSSIQSSPFLKEMMGKIMQGVATKEEKISFGKLWQQRVENIFKNIDKVISVN